MYYSGLMSDEYQGFGHLREALTREGVVLVPLSQPTSDKLCEVLECTKVGVGVCVKCGHTMCTDHIEHAIHDAMELNAQRSTPVIPVASVALMRNPDAPIAVPRRALENMTSEDIKALLLLMKTMLTVQGIIRWTDVSQINLFCV
jgi:hypothetical protein